ncbi:MAG: HDIG domain-containing protein [Kouleothrix sp.]|jgi:putative nucleotidyltransferase with HDIG domain|nr:HDIG domain-containing protein [Kouleothrix sp.]
MPSTAIREIEAFIQPLMGAVIAHDYKHAHRVRQRAKQIALAEGYPLLEIVEAAALLHDIGLSQQPGPHHAAVGAVMANQFLVQQAYFLPDQIAEIVAAIRDHSSLSGTGRLFEILQDADGLELFGAIGLLRGIASKGYMADYEPGNIRGSTWALTADAFSERFRAGIGVGSYILDQLNFQISCYENLHTQTAKQIAAPLVAYIRSFILQLEAEVVS